MSTRDTPKSPVPFGKVERFKNSHRHVVYILLTSQQVGYLQTETFFQLQKNIGVSPKKGENIHALNWG